MASATVLPRGANRLGAAIAVLDAALGLRTRPNALAVKTLARSGVRASCRWGHWPCPMRRSASYARTRAEVLARAATARRFLASQSGGCRVSARVSWSRLTSSRCASPSCGAGSRSRPGRWCRRRPTPCG
eukprot:5338678-Prymnesium_polylepis.1